MFLVSALFFVFMVRQVNAGESSKADDKTYFEISDRASFENFIKKSRKDPGLNGRLTKDIVLNDRESFESQKNLNVFGSVYGGSVEDKTAYCGDFDGNGHTITGYISCENLPMFNIIDKKGSVHDLTLDYSVFSPTHNTSGYDETQYCASMAQVNYGHIKNCHITGSVTGRGLCAGIAGVNETSGVIEGCSFSGRVVGGIGIKTVSDPTMKYAFEFVVINNGVIKDCESDAEIKSVAGLSVPYTLDGYPQTSVSEDSDASGKDGSKKPSSSAKASSSKNSASSKKETGVSSNTPDTDEDYIGPDRDTVIKLVKGDTLWALSRVYYGAGIKYKNMQLKDKNGKFGGLEGHVLTRLQIGTEVFIPRLKNDSP